MNILLPTLAVAFAAFCVWLGVRIYNRRERWAKWTLAALIGLPVLYVASFGPARWLIGQLPGERTPEWATDAFSWFYFPLIEASLDFRPLGYFLDWSMDHFG